LSRHPSFNPRARAGRDTQVHNAISVYFKFQSTRPRGARRPLSLEELADAMFQSTRPRGARRSGCSSRPREAVSIHAPARGATRSWRSSTTIPSSFNPRARAGRDFPFVLRVMCWYRFQSTRPRGARPAWDEAGATILKFQSTRPRGARQTSSGSHSTERSFNPRARAGRDLQPGSTRDRQPVSIHAPARGATLKL